MRVFCFKNVLIQITIEWSITWKRDLFVVLGAMRVIHHLGLLNVGIQGEKINQVIIDLFCRPLNGRHFLLINDVFVWTRDVG